MDCHRPSAFAMTKGAKSDEFFYFLWMNKIIVVMDCHDFCEVSQWRRGQGVVFTNSSLRELLATSGNLSMRYNYSFMEFFFFSVFILTTSGLWGLASLCKGGSCEATGGLREKLKIETQSGKMISLLNHFSLLSHEVRNERSIRN